jgi:hypothetical protein
MEIHRHTRHYEKKNWKAYLFEFFMLFLAVFCGFLAEYQLEHRLDKDREKNYIRSMINDLKRDTSNFRTLIEDGKEAMSIIDSLIFFLNTSSGKSHTPAMYYLARRITQKINPYEIFDRTYSQMKSSGNLRLLKSQAIADYISGYYFDITLLSSQQNYIFNFLLEYTKDVSRVFDASVFHKMYTDAGLTNISDLDARNFSSIILPPKGNPAFADDSQEAIHKLTGTLHYLYARILSTNSNIRNQKESAVDLMQFLRSEYRLN